MVSLKAGSPSDVLDGKNKRCSWAVFLLLVAGFIAITVWQIYASVQQRADPPTRTVIQAKYLYKQPTYTLCALGGFDVTNISSPYCQWQTSLESNAGTIPDCYAERQDIFGDGTMCVTVNPDQSFTFPSRDYYLEASFGFNYTVQKTVAGHANVAFLEWTMYMYDSSSEKSTISDSAETYLRFGANNIKVYASIKTYLDKSSVWSYDSATTFTDTVGFSVHNEVNGTFTNFMYLVISIPNTQVTVIEQVDPLSIATTIGAIGGFWNYVGVAFGAIFTIKVGEKAKAAWWQNDKDDKKDSDKKEKEKNDEKKAEQKKKEAEMTTFSSLHPSQSTSSDPSSPSAASSPSPTPAPAAAPAAAAPAPAPAEPAAGSGIGLSVGVSIGR